MFESKSYNYAYHTTNLIIFKYESIVSEKLQLYFDHVDKKITLYKIEDANDYVRSAYIFSRTYFFRSNCKKKP